MTGVGRRGGARALLLVLTCAAIAAAIGAMAPAAGASVATMLKAATGYTPSQVTTEPVCAAAAPGFSSCDAEALVTLSGQPVRPLGGSPRTSSTTVTAGPDATVTEGAPVAYSPQFFQEAYDTSWLSANAGSGQTVAIVDAFGDPNAVSDLDVFRSTDGLRAISHSACAPGTIAAHASGGPCMVITTQTGATTGLPGPNGWDVEESLDLDAVSSICPNCNILFIEANSTSNADLGAANTEAVKLGAKFISDSWGGVWSSSDSGYYIGLEDATGDAAGVESFASTGDDGDYYDNSGPGETQYPASEPYVTAVGGTAVSPAATARGVSESAWGGVAYVGAGSGCNSFDAQPVWQATVDTGCSGRAVSDLSADAAPSTGLDIYDTVSGGGWQTIGGTSLAAPLVAAFTALTGANSDSTANTSGLLSGQWAYADASKLNDVTSGTNGSGCTGGAAPATQICNAGTGWDGPTGVGSISGSIVRSGVGPSLTVPPDSDIDNGSNGYSLVETLSSSAATFTGGVYPNGSSTSVWWEYGTASETSSGTNFSAASATSKQSVGAGAGPVLATPMSISGLTASTTYYVEQCASNSAGADTICGNVTKFTTTAPGPVASGPATLSVPSLSYGSQLSLATTPAWSPTPTSVTQQWQKSADDSNWSDVGSGATYTLGASDSQMYLRAELIAADSSGTTSAYTNVLQVTAPSAASGNPTLSDTSLLAGGVLSVSTPTWSPAVTTSVAYQWQESSNNSSWSNISGATAGSYTITQYDSQQFIRAKLVATNGAGSSTFTSGSDQVGNLSEAAVITGAPALGGSSSVGSTLQLSGGSYTNSSGVTVTFKRCARSCSTAQSGSSTSYQLQKADVGYYMLATVTVAGIDGGASATASASGIVGPVISPLGGALQIGAAHVTIKSSTNAALLLVKRTIVKPKSKKAKTSSYVLTLTRAARVTGTLKAWICVLSGPKIVTCTAAFNVKHRAKLKLSVPVGDRVEVIAVR